MTCSNDIVFVHSGVGYTCEVCHKHIDCPENLEFGWDDEVGDMAYHTSCVDLEWATKKWLDAEREGQ